MTFFELILISIFSFILIETCKKKSILIHNSGETHQNYVKSKKTPLVGGIIIYVYILINFNDLNYLYVFPFLILIIGILSDSRRIFSAFFRLIAQMIVVIFFVYFQDITINETRILILDNLLSDYFGSLLFTTFCVLIVINGTNFIDGSNLIVILYYLILELVLHYLKFRGLILDGILFPIDFIPVFIVIILLNSLNKLYLGDAGSYLLGFIYSFKLISLYSLNPDISPFFIVLLLWYPAFETLFSILRKLNFNRSPIVPDSNHFHQLIYFFFSKRISKNVIKSNIVGLIINFFNFLILIFSLNNIYNSQHQIMLTLLSITIYTFIYTKLLKIKLNKKF